MTLDIETTGLGPEADRMTELAVVRVSDGAELFRWTLGDAATPEEAAGRAREYVGERSVLIHHALFDLRFLRTLHQGWRGSAVPRWICTWRAFGAGPSLDELARRCGVVPGLRHRATTDAAALAAIARQAIGAGAEGRLSDVDAWRLAPAAAPCGPAAAVEWAMPHRVPARPPGGAVTESLRVLSAALATEPADPVVVYDALMQAVSGGAVRTHLAALRCGVGTPRC